MELLNLFRCLDDTDAHMSLHFKLNNLWIDLVYWWIKDHKGFVVAKNDILLVSACVYICLVDLIYVSAIWLWLMVRVCVYVWISVFCDHSYVMYVVLKIKKRDYRQTLWMGWNPGSLLSIPNNFPPFPPTFEVLFDKLTKRSRRQC